MSNIKLKLTQEEYNRWVWHREVDKIKTDYKIQSLCNEELEEIFKCVIEGWSNRQLTYYFDVGPFMATKLRDAVRQTKLWETYNRIFHKNITLFSENGFLSERVRFGRRKINKTGTKGYKTIRVTEDTHFKLARIGAGKSMNDIIVDLIELYEDVQNEGEKQ